LGFFIEVVDDANGSTGGVYVYMWLDEVGWDDWLESVDLVDQYMQSSSIAVEWSETPPAASVDGRPRH
jgi:hypothetical protein